MSTTILGYKNKNSENVYTLDTGPLNYIDSVTSKFKDDMALKTSKEYGDKVRIYSRGNDIGEGQIVIHYIKNNQDKITLPIIYDDEEPILIRTSSLEEKKSEVERARKLLLNSKNKMFLTLFLLNNNLKDTTYNTVKMTIEEYKIAKAAGLMVFTRDNEYHIPISEVFKYRLKTSKLGPMRLLIEDTLEVWKNNLMDLPNEKLYFYSRELRVLLNEYDYRKIPRRIVYHLNFNNRALIKGNSYKTNRAFYANTTTGLSKRKILEDHRIA